MPIEIVHGRVCTQAERALCQLRTFILRTACPLSRTLCPAGGGFAFGELLFIAIKSNQKALARLSSKARLKTRLKSAFFNGLSSGIGFAFSLGSFFWRRKRKNLAKGDIFAKRCNRGGKMVLASKPSAG